jgi:glucosamine--fructose-6-phosphate aminotransferase (isomerizing)
MENKRQETATYQEIKSQTKAWVQAIEHTREQADAIRQLWREGGFSEVLFTGCGSTYYLSLAAATLFRKIVDFSGWGLPGGELLLYPDSAYATDRNILLVAISRSGTTTETVTAVKQFKEAQRGQVITITNYEDSPLANLGDLVIAIPEGKEESVAQTRSFASMFVAVTALAAVIAGRDDLLHEIARLPDCGEKLMRLYEPLAREIGEDLTVDRFYFLGGGVRYGLACEANLKMKEMTLTHSEPFHFLEFRHGPMSMISDSTLVIGMLSEANHAHEKKVLDEMAQLGSRTLSLGEADAEISFACGLSEAIRNVLHLPVLQLMAYYRSLKKGFNPDRPNNLTAVVELDF